jgi:hypothetical protein
MASPDLPVHFGAILASAKELADCRAPPAEGRWHPVSNAMMTANVKEAQEHGAQQEAPESGEQNRSNGQPPEDRQLLELLELQQRMFPST